MAETSLPEAKKGSLAEYEGGSGSIEVHHSLDGLQE